MCVKKWRRMKELFTTKSGYLVYMIENGRQWTVWPLGALGPAIFQNYSMAPYSTLETAGVHRSNPTQSIKIQEISSSEVNFWDIFSLKFCNECQQITLSLPKMSYTRFLERSW